MWYAISSKEKVTFIHGDIVAVGESSKEVREIFQALVRAKELVAHEESLLSEY